MNEERKFEREELYFKNVFDRGKVVSRAEEWNSAKMEREKWFNFMEREKKMMIEIVNSKAASSFQNGESGEEASPRGIVSSVANQHF